jgi:hypothetical protein
MAEWRERGYVPDSDEEEEESFPRTSLIERQPCQPEEAGRPPSIRTEVAGSEAQHGAGTTPVHAGTSGNCLKNGDAPHSLEGEDPSLLPISNARKSELVHDVDSMEVDDPVPSSKPVVEQLQESLELGLKQVGETLRRSLSPDQNIENGSQSSSPLSSLGSLGEELRKASTVEEVVLLTPEIRPIGTSTHACPHSLPEIFAPQRAFRQRTEIQLHPYALEDARYQRELKARGLKPVRIAASQTQHPKRSTASTEEDASLFSGSPMDEDSAPAPTLLGTQDEVASDLGYASSDGFEQPASPPNNANGDEDLPDLADLFGSKTTRLRSPPSKTIQGKKATVPPQRPEHLAPDIFDLPGDEEDTAHNLSPRRAAFFVPPSPPHSRSVSQSDEACDKLDGKPDSEATPGRLPTPLLSSGMQPRKRPLIEPSGSSQNVSEDGAGSEVTSSSEEEQTKLGKIKAMRRRMKGVLPASWIKLDLKQQTVKEQHHKDGHSTRATIDGIGVAKPVSTARPHSGFARLTSSLPKHPFHLDFSDEDVSSNDGTELEPRTDTDDLGESILDLYTTDILEDDPVDRMPPGRERRPKSASRPQKKRQQRLSDTWQEASKGRKHRSTFIGNRRTSNTEAHRASRTKRQRKDKDVPQLSILDAPDFVQLSRASQPRFLKVAFRRAQKQTRQVTQNPRDKFFKLVSEGETRDINENLVNWQDGHIRPHRQIQASGLRSGPAAISNPLPQATATFQDLDHVDDSPWTRSPSTDSLSTLRRSTNATVSRILFKQQGLRISLPREGASPSSPLNPTASVESLRARVNLRAPRQNRAGLGTLQRAVTHPRTAQLEKTRPDNSSSSLLRPPMSDNSATAFRPGYAYPARIATHVVEVGEQLPIHTQKAKQQITVLPRRGAIRKATAPQHKMATKADLRNIETTSHSSLAPAPDKISKEAELVVDVLAMLMQEKSLDPNTCKQSSLSAAMKDNWSSLWTAMRNWLDTYAQDNNIHTANESRRAEHIFRRCHELVLEWEESICDNLTRKAAWFFSAFGMADPFDDKIHPYVGLPLFFRESDGVAGLAHSGPDDTTFHVFLRMLAISLDAKSKDALSCTGDLAAERRKRIDLQSYINRLYPNNGRLISEKEDVPEKDLASLWNRCSLYLTLYCYTVEGCRPRISQFQNLVDFSQSHVKACEIMLEIWGVLVRFHAKTTERSQLKNLEQLSKWIQDMIQKMLNKWSNAETEVMNQLEGRPLQGHAADVVRWNRERVESFLQKALSTWAVAIGECESQAAAAQVLGVAETAEPLLQITIIFTNNYSMLQQLVTVVDEYLHKYGVLDPQLSVLGYNTMYMLSHFIDDMLRQRFNMIKEESIFDRAIHRRLTYDWSLIASFLHKAQKNSWDDFLEPVGEYSWERFSDAARSAKYKTLFVTHIIKTSEDTYRANKYWYLSYWLRCLLRPLGDLAFEHELSKAVLSADQYEPMLLGQPLLLECSVDGFHLTLKHLKHTRTDMLERLVEGIATASSPYNSQAVDPYALDPPEMADLLKVMMDTLKTTRKTLKNGSDEQKEYDKMVCSIAEKMDRYTNSIVPLDRWFREADFVPVGQRTLRQRFGGTPPAAGTMTVSKQDIVWFQLTCQKAAIYPGEDWIYSVLPTVYVKASDLDISETEWYLPKQLAMMQQVFPAYLELALTDAGTLLGAPVLQCLDAICSNVFMRSVNIGTENQTQVLEALNAIIVAARMALQRSNVDRAIGRPGSVKDLFALFDEPPGTRALAFSCVVRIARIAILQYYEVIRCSGLPQDGEEFEQVSSHAHFIYLFVRSQWECRRDSNDDHWKLLEYVDKYDLSHPEANRVKQFAKAELEKALRVNWNKDDRGKWWVSQGRETVPVRLRPTAGVRDAQPQEMVENEMQAYIDMYEGNDSQKMISSLADIRT